METYGSMISYFPCIKYKIPGDPEVDGTDTFFIAESMHFIDVSEWDLDLSDCRTVQSSMDTEVWYGLGIRCSPMIPYEPQIEQFYQCNISFTCENDEKALYKIVNADYALEIKSEYHSVGYNEKFLDVWMFTNSTEVTLNYNLYRLGQETSAGSPGQGSEQESMDQNQTVLEPSCSVRTRTTKILKPRIGLDHD